MSRQIKVWTTHLEDSQIIDLIELKQKLDGKFNAETASGLSAVPVSALYDAVCEVSTPPTFFEVCGEDGFYASIPWRLVDRSYFRFPNLTGDSNGSGGLRLFVQGESNACLNVKSIVDIQFGYEGELKQPAYGKKSLDHFEGL